MSLFMFHAGLKRGKVLGAEVSFPRPERLEKGGKPPAEFHARADQLGQFAIDWLYQAQLWVQAEGLIFFFFGRDGYSLHKCNDSNLKTM